MVRIRASAMTMAIGIGTESTKPMVMYRRNRRLLHRDRKTVKGMKLSVNEAKTKRFQVNPFVASRGSCEMETHATALPRRPDQTKRTIKKKKTDRERNITS
jgi:hypothetical protein